MKKWKKFLISLITVFVLDHSFPSESAILPGTVCVTEAAPRISSSKLTMIKGQSSLNLKITGLKKGRNHHLEEQQFQNRHCKQSWQAFCKICRKCYNYCSGKRNPLCLQG